jgi:hypothetical protein
MHIHLALCLTCSSFPLIDTNIAAARRLQMKSRPSVSSDSLLRDPPDFSFVLGGPFFQLLRRMHLSDDALMLAR